MRQGCGLLACARTFFLESRHDHTSIGISEIIQYHPNPDCDLTKSVSQRNAQLKMSSNVLNRESAWVKQNIRVPRLPHLAVRGYLCFRCLLPSKHLSKCTGCRRAVYCGKACQTWDWQIQHKKDCKILKMINAIEVLDTASSRSRQIWTQSLVRCLRFQTSVTQRRCQIRLHERYAIPFTIFRGRFLRLLSPDLVMQDSSGS
jgi:MYND finger